ncbi:rRNA-binding ribosome biosynthesis protein utp25 [Glutinoglossum americanum]|uniref:U3 small nucleolar RNA-associated protein 25 n=1 Tax=Glutinoglossum americanum TaxID=1670608 RepID=A0A9P8L5W0_9PEZI|nr:rRNA-binding ribosome biosynthesis protein utp25 [Glutinoglossum americanum]
MAYARGRDSRGSRSGRVRGGRSGGGSRGYKKSSFTASRIAKPEEIDLENSGDDGSEPGGGNSTPESEGLDEDEEDDDEDEGDLGSSSVRPYSILIQSLNAKNTPGQPQHKRRKLDSVDAQLSGSHVEDNIRQPEGMPEGNDELSSREEADEDENEEEELGEADYSDPFETHFANPDNIHLSEQIKELSKSGWHMHKIQYDGAGKAILTTPASDKQKSPVNAVYFTGPENLKIKKRLSVSISTLRPKFNPLEGAISPYIFNYQDLLFCARSLRNANDLRTLTCLHALNHVFKTRDRVIKNNSRLAKGDISEDVELRDQGFTRPKILMILPTKQSCVKAIDTIITLCEPEQQENKKRFQDSYVETNSKISDEKPEDFRDLFEGNDDDMFRIGLKFTRKTVKYFAQFYNSDIVIASPLGLRMAIGTDAKKKDYDFLSSIEVMIVDQADALLMQNWEYVECIFEHLNLQPKEAHGCDFSRVRNWYLDGTAKFRRQTIILSAFNTPELNSIFSNHMKNTEGKIKFTSNYDGAILELGITIKQSFSRYDSPIPTTDPDSRFRYFTTAVIPSLSRHGKSSKDLEGQGILVFIPSYLDFVRVRNHFSSSTTTQDISFGAISEYTSVRDAARSRSHFLTGKHSVLLYTERAHHFRRYAIKGVKRVIMYGLPDNPVFYREIIGGYLERSIAEGKVDSGEVAVRSIFSKWDGLKLERIVGSKRVGTMMRSVGDTFDFV